MSTRRTATFHVENPVARYRFNDSLSPRTEGRLSSVGENDPRASDHTALYMDLVLN